MVEISLSGSGEGPGWVTRVFERDGPSGLASKQRGRPSNRRLPAELRREALTIVRSQYEGFGPTLAPREADRAPRPGVLGRDAPVLDGRGRSLGPSGSP